MKLSICSLSLALLGVLIGTSCRDATSPAAGVASRPESLVGAWRSQIRFSGGALAEMKNLDFMYVFNSGGTMTESSNYDAAPPVPPAYGVWRTTGLRQFEVKYMFYSANKGPGMFEDIAKGGGWLPTGHGILTEKITLSEDGKTFKSAMTFAAFDQAGKPAEGAGEGTGTDTRIDF